MCLCVCVNGPTGCMHTCNSHAHYNILYSHTYNIPPPYTPHTHTHTHTHTLHTHTQGDILTDEATMFELAACAMQAQCGDYRRYTHYIYSLYNY